MPARCTACEAPAKVAPSEPTSPKKDPYLGTQGHNEYEYSEPYRGPRDKDPRGTYGVLYILIEHPPSPSRLLGWSCLKPSQRLFVLSFRQSMEGPKTWKV